MVQGGSKTLPWIGEISGIAHIIRCSDHRFTQLSALRPTPSKTSELFGGLRANIIWSLNIFEENVISRPVSTPLKNTFFFQGVQTKASHECHGFKPVLYSRVFRHLKLAPVSVASGIRTVGIHGCETHGWTSTHGCTSYSQMNQLNNGVPNKKYK